MKKQRIVSILLTFCLILSMIPTAFAAKVDNFTDVSETDWFYDYVDYVTSKGYFQGTTGTTFSPNANMTRAMFVVVLARFDNVKVDNSQSAFTDVEPGAWCAGAINWAAENKIVSGIGNGKFDPNASITRAQMCAIMDRYVDYYTAKHKVTVAKNGTSTDLADQNQIPAYARTPVKNCQIYGLIAGYEDGTFRPQATSTRAHVAAVIYRLHFLIDGAKPSSSGSNGGGGGGGGGGSTSSTYTLTYNANGGTFSNGNKTYADSLRNSSSTKSFTVISGNSEPTRDGYKLLGWADSSNATSASYTAGSTIRLTASKTIYAVWEKITEPTTEWTITYQYDGSTLKTETVADGISYTVLDGDAAGIPEGLVLVEWTDADGKVYAPGDVIENVSKNVTLTARCIKAKDYIGIAVKNAMEQINSKYELRADAAYNDENKVYVDALSFYGSDSDGANDRRPQTLSAGASVSDDVAVKVIEAATEIACELVGMDSSDLPSGGEAAETIKEIVNSIIDTVEETLGIDIRKDDSVEDTVNLIANAVYEKVILPEGKAIWTNFYDEDGNYYCGDITVTTTSSSGTYTAILKVDQENHSTTLDGSKKEAVKHVAASIARQMFASLKEQASDWISDPTLKATVNVTFKDNTVAKVVIDGEETTYGVSTENYPHEYPVNFQLALDGNDFISYKFADTSYLKLTITEDIQNTWNDGLNTFAGVVTDDPELKAKVVKLIQDTIDKQADAICQTVQEQLEPYGIELVNTTGDNLKAAMDPVVEPWVEANWNAIIDSAANGTLTGLNTTALVDAAWSVVEKDVPKDDDLDSAMQELVNGQLEEAGINDDYLVKTVNDKLTSDDFMSGAVSTFIKMNATFEADGEHVSIPVTSVSDINTLLSCDKLTAKVTYGSAEVTVNVSGESDEDGNAGSFSDFIRPEVVSLAGAEMEKQLSGHATLASLIGDNDALKDYIIYSALCEVGLNFDTEKKAAANATVTVTDDDGNSDEVALMDYLADLIKDLGKKEIGKKLDEEIAKVDVSEYVAENTDYEKELALYNGMKFPSIMDKKFSNVSRVLRNKTLQDKIGNTGDSYVEQYLAKIINKIPAGAKVTINGEEIDKTTFSELGKATTTVGAMNAAANILDSLNGISSLTLNDFAEEKDDGTSGIPIVITYNQRNFSFNLVIEAE